MPSLPNKKDILVYEKDNKYGLINLFNLKFTENIYESISQEVDTGFILENEGKYSLIKSGEFFENKIENIFHSRTITCALLCTTYLLQIKFPQEHYCPH